MYATSLLLFLPRDDRGWLLDACRKMSRRLFLERRNDPRARFVLCRVMTARMEDASRWRICRRRNIALQNDPLLSRVRVRDRNGGEKGLRVWHRRLAIQIFRRRELYDLAQIHHR